MEIACTVQLCTCTCTLFNCYYEYNNAIIIFIRTKIMYKYMYCS